MTECAGGSAESGDPVAGQFDPASWQKAFASEPNGGNCVEVNFSTAQVGLRDSKLAQSPVFVLAPGEWQALTAAISSG